MNVTAESFTRSTNIKGVVLSCFVQLVSLGIFPVATFSSSSVFRRLRYDIPACSEEMLQV